MTDTKPRALRSDAARNLRRVLDAADALFAEEGIGVSVEQIAARAGVGVGTVYRRFPSKEALIEHLVADFVTDQRATLRDALAEPDGNGVEFLLRGSGELFVKHQGCLSRQLLLGSPSDDVQKALRREHPRAVRKLLERDQTAGTIRSDIAPTDIHLLLTSLQRIVLLTVRDAPDAWRRHVDIQLAGISPAADRPLPHPPMTRGELERVGKRRRDERRRGMRP